MVAFFGSDAVEPSAQQGLGQPGTMTGLLREAGFAEIEEQAVDDTVEVPIDRRVWSSRMERNYPDLINGLTVKQRTALEATMRQAFEPYRNGEVYRLRAEVRLGVGTSPLAEGSG